MDLFEALGLGSKPPDDETLSFELHVDSSSTGRTTRCRSMPPASVGTCNRHSRIEHADLQELRISCLQLILPYVEGHVWQKDQLEFKLSDEDTPPWEGNSAGGIAACKSLLCHKTSSFHIPHEAKVHQAEAP
jgi:hypothetical protein